MTDNLQVIWLPQALKSLARLDYIAQRRLMLASEALATNPFPPKSKKLTAPENLHRIRVGDYRLIYVVEHDNLIILVVSVGHRRDIYKQLGR